MLRKLGVAAALLAGCWLLGAAEYTLSVERVGKNEPCRTGERVEFVARARVDGQPVSEGVVTFKLTNDGRDLLGCRTAPLADGEARVDFTALAPGFLWCNAEWKPDEGETKTALAAAAFSPDEIRPGQPEPADFDAFWAAGKAQAAAVELDPELSPAPELSTDTLEVYRISFANIEDTRLYGFLSIPKGQDGPFPAVLVIPGASPAANQPGGHLIEGVITLFLNVHSYEPAPIGQSSDAVQKTSYGTDAYQYINAGDKEHNFFRRAWLGMDRAVDFLLQHPQFDGRNLGVCGWSQGGGSTLALAGLNHHFTYAVANQPALCDHGAYRQGRTPGWPFFADQFNADLAVMEAVGYIDAASFAKRIQCPTVVLVGWVDGACHPGSVMAAYNNIPGEKRLVHEPEASHHWAEAYNQAIQDMLESFRHNR